MATRKFYVSFQTFLPVGYALSAETEQYTFATDPQTCTITSLGIIDFWWRSARSGKKKKSILGTFRICSPLVLLAALPYLSPMVVELWTAACLHCVINWFIRREIPR